MFCSATGAAGFFSASQHPPRGAGAGAGHEFVGHFGAHPDVGHAAG